MAKPNSEKNTDIIIKEAFDYMVQMISQKVENKKPKAQDPAYVHQDYDVLEKGLKVLEKIADNPKEYFSAKYEDKVYSQVLEISRLTGVRFDRLLDELMSIWVQYYSMTSKVEKEKLAKEIEKLHDKIKRKITPGFFARASAILRGISKSKQSVAREKQK